MLTGGWRRGRALSGGFHEAKPPVEGLQFPRLRFKCRLQLVNVQGLQSQFSSEPLQLGVLVRKQALDAVQFIREAIRLLVRHTN